MNAVLKPVEFKGGSLNDLRLFPVHVRREAGLQLARLQRGLDPQDWKPMKTVGAGVKEIRLRDIAGAYRGFTL